MSVEDTEKVEAWLIDKAELSDVGLAARVEVAQKVGRLLRKEQHDDREMALQLARILIEDVSVSVREALAKELQACTFLPTDMINIIVADIEQVSVPFLMASSAVTDDYLEKLISCGSDDVREAIAVRDNLAEAIGFAICDLGQLGALEKLMDNHSAEMAHRGFDRAINRFPEERSLMDKIAQRADVPVEIVERVVFKVARQYAEHLTKKFDLAADFSSYLTSLASRQVFAQTLEMSPINEVLAYQTQLHSVSGLNSTVLLGYLQHGHLRLFIAAMSVLIDRPFDVVERILSTGDRGALTKMLEKAHFSRQIVGVLVIAYERHFSK